MKHLIVRTKTLEEAQRLCAMVPINKCSFTTPVSKLAQLNYRDFGENSCFRITDGQIKGRGHFADHYHDNSYEKIEFSDFVKKSEFTKELPALSSTNSIGILCKTKEQAEKIVAAFDCATTAETTKANWIKFWDMHKEETVYTVNEDGTIIKYGNHTYSEYTIYNAEEILKSTATCKEFTVAVKRCYQLNDLFEYYLNTTGKTAEEIWETYRSRTVISIKNGMIISYSCEPQTETKTYTNFKNDNNISKYSCMYIAAKNELQARYICRNIPSAYNHITENDFLFCWTAYRGDTAYKILNGKIVGIQSTCNALDFCEVFPLANTAPEFYMCEGYKTPVETAINWVILDDGKVVCKQYWDENYVTCQHCGKTILKSEASEYDGVYLCSHCADTEVEICDVCGNYHYRGFMRISNINICDRCYDTYDYITCESCGDIVSCDETCYDDENDEYYCSNCYRERLKSKSIRNYSYKPSPNFLPACSGDQRYLGVELEVDDGGYSCENAYSLLEIANANNNHIYIKSDGSIGDGFEIVSHPMTLDYHMNKMPWKDVMQKAINMCYHSHQTRTCGLHVHVNRLSLGDSIAEQEDVISKILLFVEKNWDEIAKFTRRDADRLDRWAARYGYENSGKKILDKAKNDCDRYHAVNILNAHTIEFRMFRGTLKYNTFIATLQFVNRVCELCKTMNEIDINNLTWNDFVSEITETELIQYLKERGLYTNTTTLETTIEEI